MKKIFYALTTVIMCMIMSACCNNNAKDLAKAPYLNEEINYNDGINAFVAAGFTDVKAEPTYEVNRNILKNDGEVKEIYIEGEYEYSPGKEYKKDSKVILMYYDFSKLEKSDTSLSKHFAKVAFEKYGKAHYPDEFVCHWTTGLIQSQYSNGEYYFKVKVTAKPANQTEYDAVAEGTISGTDTFPLVTQFIVTK